MKLSDRSSRRWPCGSRPEHRSFWLAITTPTPANHCCSLPGASVGECKVRGQARSRQSLARFCKGRTRLIRSRRSWICSVSAASTNRCGSSAAFSGEHGLRGAARGCVNSLPSLLTKIVRHLWVDAVEKVDPKTDDTVAVDLGRQWSVRCQSSEGDEWRWQSE